MSNDDEGYFSGAPSIAPAAKIIRALKEHGMDHTYVNGVLHGVSPGDPPVPIGNSVTKLRNFLGYKGGGAVHGKKGHSRLDRKSRVK